jgi:hypothetical protein
VTYVGTFAVPATGKLIRVDVQTHGLLTIATYTVTYCDGSSDVERATLGPDLFGVGVPIMAATEFMRDLHFHDEAEGVLLVHGSPVFDVPEMELVLDCNRVAHDMVGLTTTARVQ